MPPGSLGHRDRHRTHGHDGKTAEINAILGPGNPFMTDARRRTSAQAFTRRRSHGLS